MLRVLSVLWVLFLLMAMMAFASSAGSLNKGHLSAEDSPLLITPTYPLPNSTIYTEEPNITATFTDPAAAVNPSSVEVRVDGIDVTNVEGDSITAQGIRYDIPGLLKLPYGNASVNIIASDALNNRANYTWNFSVQPALPSPGLGLSIKPLTLLLYVGIGAGIFGIAFGGGYAYMRQVRHFAFRKYFATHPVEKQYLVLYLPIAVAFVVTLFALDFVEHSPAPPWWAIDAVLVAGLWIALTAYALDARREMSRTRAFERAFSQFLFEMADAMRGGLDPAKSVIELSSTYTNIMAKPLRIAADGIRLGRPFNVVLRNMVAPMNSALISRYAGLIADASTAGGETAAVVHRAAKDMDDFIKIEQERSNQLTLPVAVLYIAYGILMAVLFALLYISPSLGSLNISFIGGAPLSGGATGSTVPKLAFDVLRNDFLYLGLIVSIGTGAIIGAFTEGRAKYGLIHSLALSAATLVAFIIFFPH